ncbi:hypothetical protein [Achromobacter animicus]|uniref:hypothetical protein n=1 Tax=Achromobacter animicus TaxID=1389935 RepID=UPI001583307F|nr:hypothetical protein [Achromobacter animicus]
MAIQTRVAVQIRAAIQTDAAIQSRTAAQINVVIRFDVTSSGAAESKSTHLGAATRGSPHATLARKRPSRRKSGDATVNAGLRNCHWVPVYRHAHTSWRCPALKPPR